MKVGVQFENILKRGLLTFAETLANDAPEFRYVYHEIAEETQHSMMFQEFVNRTRAARAGHAARAALCFARTIPSLARRFPELFFVFVLGGEEPIDQMQRRALRERQWRHPLAQRISQIHVIEEARHMSFARAYLVRHAPRLGWFGRNLLALRSPLILGNMVEPDARARRRTSRAATRSRKDVLRAGLPRQPRLPRPAPRRGRQDATPVPGAGPDPAAVLVDLAAPTASGRLADR